MNILSQGCLKRWQVKLIFHQQAKDQNMLWTEGVDLYIEISAQECQQLIKVQKQQFLISTWRIWHWSKSYTCSHTCDEISDFLRRSFEISYNLLEDSPGSSRLGIPRNNVTVRGLQECPGSYSWPERSSAHPESLSSTDSVPWTCKTWPMLKCSTFKIVSTFSFWGSPACAGQMDLFASPGVGQNVSIKKSLCSFWDKDNFLWSFLENENSLCSICRPNLNPRMVKATSSR